MPFMRLNLQTRHAPTFTNKDAENGQFRRSFSPARRSGSEISGARGAALALRDGPHGFTLGWVRGVS
jgi:hypothetical protein